MSKSLQELRLLHRKNIAESERRWARLHKYEDNQQAKLLTSWLGRYARPATIVDWRKYVLAAVAAGHSVKNSYDYPFDRYNKGHPDIAHRPEFQVWVVKEQPSEHKLPDTWGANSVILLIPEGIDVVVGGHNSAILENGTTLGWPNIATFSDF